MPRTPDRAWRRFWTKSRIDVAISPSGPPPPGKGGGGGGGKGGGKPDKPSNPGKGKGKSASWTGQGKGTAMYLMSKRNADVTSQRAFEGFAYRHSGALSINGTNAFPVSPFTTRIPLDQQRLEVGGHTALSSNVITMQSSVESVARYLLLMGGVNHTAEPGAPIYFHHMLWDSALGTARCLNGNVQSFCTNLRPPMATLRQFTQVANGNQFWIDTWTQNNGHTMSVDADLSGLYGVFLRADERGFAAKGSTQALTNGAWTTTGTWTENYDGASAFNHTTGVYTVPAAHNDRLGIFVFATDGNVGGGTIEQLRINCSSSGRAAALMDRRQNTLRHVTMGLARLQTGETYTADVYVDAASKVLLNNDRTNFSMAHIEAGASVFAYISGSFTPTGSYTVDVLPFDTFEWNPAGASAWTISGNRLYPGNAMVNHYVLPTLNYWGGLNSGGNDDNYHTIHYYDGSSTTKVSGYSNIYGLKGGVALGRPLKITAAHVSAGAYFEARTQWGSTTLTAASTGIGGATKLRIADLGK